MRAQRGHSLLCIDKDALILVSAAGRGPGHYSLVQPPLNCFVVSRFPLSRVPLAS